MARAALATKVKKKPGDFKRPKRKVGRRAPQAANVTSVGISSRRINLLEQSVLQDKGDAAQLTHRNLTLPELLQQLGHYNAHVRQRALQGLRELAGQDVASNLRANAGVLLERFLPALLDEEAVVRDAAVAAWRALLPVLRAGDKSLAPFAKLVVVYFCSGLTHLQVGVRQDTLRAIGALLDEAPELLRVDAGSEALARLLENFGDLLGSAQTQGIRMINSYDLLAASDTSAKAQAGRRNARPSQSQKSKQKKSKKPKMPSGALALRFSALKVLHKLLASMGNESSASTGATIVSGVRSCSVPSTKTLLLYPLPGLVANVKSATPTPAIGGDANSSWEEKTRALLPAVLDLWLECLEGDTDSLSDEHVEHMMYIVECATTVIAANTELLAATAASESAKTDVFFQAALSLREELLAPGNFPMLPSASVSLAADAEDGAGLLSRWHGMNAALARLACVYLRLPPSLRGLETDENEETTSLEMRVRMYVVSTLTKYQDTAELRAVASMQGVLQSLLEVVTLILASGTSKESSDVDGDHQKVLLDAVTQFYVRCSPKTVSFRSCTAFAVQQLELALRGQQRGRQQIAWPLVMQWVACFAELLGQLEPQHMDLGRRSLLALISVLKQLPAQWATGEQMDGVLVNLASFFDLAASPSAAMDGVEQQRLMARTRFDSLSAADQLTFVALVFHLPQYSVRLLRALASCCKSPRVCAEAKSFLVDILFQRREALDLAHLVSFLVSASLAPVSQANAQQQLELVNHVCRTFLAMNLGNALPTILTPTLSKSQAQEGMGPTELHTLLLLYRACVISAAKPSDEQQRSEIPVAMERELVGLSTKVLVAYAPTAGSPEVQKDPEELVAREQELLLVDTCVATLALSEANVFASLLDDLLAPQQQPLALVRRLRVVQALARTASLSAAFGRHQNHLARLLQTLEEHHDADPAATSEEDVPRIVRQLRGDLELLAVGQLPTANPNSSK